MIREKDKNLYNVSCRCEMKAFGPRTVEPDTFNIRHTEYAQAQVRPNYFALLHCSTFTLRT